jgi:hypothetical protein
VMTAAFMRRSEPDFDLFPVARALVAGISEDYTRPPPRKFPGGSICRMAQTIDGSTMHVPAKCRMCGVTVLRNGVLGDHSCEVAVTST